LQRGGGEGRAMGWKKKTTLYYIQKRGNITIENPFTARAGEEKPVPFSISHIRGGKKTYNKGQGKRRSPNLSPIRGGGGEKRHRRGELKSAIILYRRGSPLSGGREKKQKRSNIIYPARGREALARKTFPPRS